ncbi:Non-specific serine/threonine protein kinase [Melia azedarach]|uniref:Non-specific serine/threonine protein kinase n=1 Tax=Melia azedarach TaxID=155640 RepID=A0ACC1Y8U9_MELAZ|nr:Non-specific serine/threonine protein kinase [Melia azedarach]
MLKDVLEWESANAKYELGRMLGQGNFAKVYYARNLKTGQSVAIKAIDKEKVLKVGLIDQTKREVSIMRMVQHPNVMQLYEVMASKSKIYFVIEYAKGGELFRKVSKGKLKEDTVRKYFQQLIRAIDFCHSRGISHRDLKPENLLLDENGILKVSDFGLSALAESKHQDGLLHTTCGTPAYVAPEVICRQGYDGAKSDIWSCGVILYVLLAGYLPFHDSNLMAMYRKIAKADFKFPSWFSPEGLHSKSSKSKTEVKELIPLDIDAAFGLIENNAPPEAPKLLVKPTNLNAFHIISLSTGFDLSGLFVKNDQKEEVKFTSMHSASAIISKLEDIAKPLRLKIIKKDGGLLKLEGSEKGRLGVLSFDVELFEFSPSFHLVELKKSGGDNLEFQMMLKQEIKPALKEIVWAWQGDEHQLLQQHLLSS